VPRISAGQGIRPGGVVSSNLACAQDLNVDLSGAEGGQLATVPSHQSMAAPYVVASANTGGVPAIVYVNQHGFIRKPRSSKKRYLEGTALNKNEGVRGPTRA
jgi:hypothetical protein